MARRVASQRVNPRARALKVCISAAIRAGGRSLSIHDYARESGISARMLIHHFGTKADLERAIIRGVDEELRLKAGVLAQSLGGLAAVDQLLQGFKAPASAPVRALFRTLLAKALTGDGAAIEALVEERKRWISMFDELSGDKRGQDIVERLLGAALDAILNDVSAARASKHPSRQRRR
jgi:AcrR family transcriptional regulator